MLCLKIILDLKENWVQNKLYSYTVYVYGLKRFYILFRTLKKFKVDGSILFGQ